MPLITSQRSRSLVPQAPAHESGVQSTYPSDTKAFRILCGSFPHAAGWSHCMRWGRQFLLTASLLWEEGVEWLVQGASRFPHTLISNSELFEQPAAHLWTETGLHRAITTLSMTWQVAVVRGRKVFFLLVCCFWNVLGNWVAKRGCACGCEWNMACFMLRFHQYQIKNNKN